MRLIDADELKKQIAGMAIINNYPQDKANALCELIDAQPTAYDIDNVADKLEELHETYLNRYGLIGNNSISAIAKAIEIVKQGGADEHKTLKCEGCRFEHTKEDDAFNCDCVHCSRAYSDCYEKVAE